MVVLDERDPDVDVELDGDSLRSCCLPIMYGMSQVMFVRNT